MPMKKMLTNRLSKTRSKLIVQTLRNMNVFMSHAFFHYFFSNLISYQWLARGIRCVCTYINTEHMFKPRASIPCNHTSYEINALFRLLVAVTGDIIGPAILSLQEKAAAPTTSFTVQHLNGNQAMRPPNITSA